jgi:predicted Zn-dependent protease
MKAYLDCRAGEVKHTHVGEVVTSQDYHERGPHAYSHRTEPKPTINEALDAAAEWAKSQNLEIVDSQMI